MGRGTRHRCRWSSSARGMPDLLRIASLRCHPELQEVLGKLALVTNVTKFILHFMNRAHFSISAEWSPEYCFFLHYNVTQWNLSDTQWIDFCSLTSLFFDCEYDNHSTWFEYDTQPVFFFVKGCVRLSFVHSQTSQSEMNNNDWFKCLPCNVFLSNVTSM